MTDRHENADVYIQWKGTDACFDFHCPCGNSDHIDANFAYYVRCASCGTTYQMPSDLEARCVPDGEVENDWNIVQARKDGWDCNYSTQQNHSPTPDDDLLARVARMKVAMKALAQAEEVRLMWGEHSNRYHNARVPFLDAMVVCTQNGDLDD
jgi:ribosomal protein S27E